MPASAMRADGESGGAAVARVRRALWPALIGPLVFVAAAVATAASIQFASVLVLLYIGVSVIVGAVAAPRLLWMLRARRARCGSTESYPEGEEPASAHSFSLIVVPQHGEQELEATLSRLIEADHPAFEVLVVVGADDGATRETSERMADVHPNLVKVVVDGSCSKSRAKALNAALPDCTGTVTGVVDAENQVHSALLRRVERCFLETGATVVQASAQLLNLRSTWLGIRHVLDSHFWFRSRVHLQAHEHFILLGGNSLFVRTQALRAVGGWDPESLAEDCELGVRLSAFGARAAVLYEPGLIMRRECSPGVGAFVRQRMRWNQGYLQTFSNVHWRQLPLPQRALGVYILAMPYAMALAWALILIATGATVAFGAPNDIALFSLVPALLIASMLAVEVAGLSEVLRAHGQRASARDYGRVVVRLPLYQALLAFAAARAAAREAHIARGWQKPLRLLPPLLLGLGFLVVVATVVTVILPGNSARVSVDLLARDLWDAVGWRTLVSVAVSLIVGSFAWRALVELRQSWNLADWLAPVRLPSDDFEMKHASPGRHKPRWLPNRQRTEALLAVWLTRLQPKLADDTRTSTPGLAGLERQPPSAWASAGAIEFRDSSRREFSRAALLLAVAASVLWLVWRRPGPWEDGVVIGLAVLFTVRKVRPLKRHAPPALHVLTRPTPRLTRAREIAAVTLVQRHRRSLTDQARTTLPLLVLLNVLIAAERSSTALFVLMASIDLFVLSCLTRTSSHAPDTGVAALDQPRVNRSRAERPPDRDPEETTLPSGTSRGVTPAKMPGPDATGRKTGFARKIQPTLAVAALVLAICWIAYAHPGPALIPAVLVLGLALPFTAGADRERAITMALAIGVVAATIDYVSWRFAVTNWAGWWIAAPLLIAEAFGALHVLGFQLTIWPWPKPQIDPTEDPARSPIFIFIPTLNEGARILRPTLQGCLLAREQYLQQHPHGQVTIVVCNDGRAANAPGWEDIDALARELGVSCVTRIRPGGAKAGNIENARQAVHATGDALLAIFDADQVPKPDFLVKTIPPFGDPKIGWVQTGQYYANLGNPVSRWADDQQSMFYNLLCPGKAAMNAAFICGTNVVIRTAALDEIGGLPQDSVTEDFAASIALHPRWRSLYLSDVLATGLGPLDIPSYFRQQARWALGTLGVFRSNWRDILLPRKNGLRLGQRAQYFLACTHYLCGLRDLVYLVSPLLFIATGIPAVHGASLTQYLVHFLPYAVLGLFGMWYAGRGVAGLRGIIIGFGSFPALLGSLFAVVLRRKTGFVATAKERAGRVSLVHVRVHVALVFLCVVSLVLASEVKGQQAASLFVSVLWVLYSLVLLGSFLWLALADVGLGALMSKWAAADEVAAKLPYPSKMRRRVDGVKPAWNVGVAALMASPLLFGNQLASLPVFSAPSTRPFVISHERPGPPYLGVSVPTPLLWTRPNVLERDLRTRVSIVGRTQDVQDRFDVTWADTLAAHGARPWITLEFGVFGPNRRRPLDASLLAIENGVHDGDLTRWASEIRDFGKPVYLTILRHVDKNWSLSSAVTGGGIPEDAPKVWNHVRSIFRAVGARNVVWVWAPADPIHDQAYAPAPSAIDVVLQSFINYPGERWGDPRLVLQRLSERYPRKPFFVEAGLAGAPAAKAAWLATLRQALDTSSQLYAFLDHEGGPELTPTTEQTQAWSLASDPLSLAATKAIVASLRTERRAR